MSKSTNVVVLSGNLTKDPELRTTSGGTTICAMRMAVNDRTKVNGEWTDRALYFDVTAFGAQGENAAKWLTKGAHIEVTGRLNWREWEKDGQKRQAVDVIADNIVFPPKGQGQGDYQQQAKASLEKAGLPVVEDDDEIPF